MQAIEAALARHDQIALQLSGGRDSIACLYLLRPYLDRITVYWCNSGAAFPETVEVIEQLSAWVPNFVEIAGSQPQSIARDGYPSDIVPVSRTPMGMFVAASSAQPIQSRYQCCYNSIMLPMHQQMVHDGITMIIRGQKNDDANKSTARSGLVENGVEYLFPIEDWTSAQVMEYLKAEGAPIPRFYSMLNAAPDCMTCSAWWEEGVAPYLRLHHPEAHVEVQRRLDVIRQAIDGHIVAFNNEIAS